MLRLILIALAVFSVLRLLARLAPARQRTPRAAAQAPARAQRAPRKPSLSAAERAEIEAERERALSEGRQLDAIKLHRRLTGG